MQHAHELDRAGADHEVPRVVHVAGVEDVRRRPGPVAHGDVGEVQAAHGDTELEEQREEVDEAERVVLAALGLQRGQRKLDPRVEDRGRLRGGAVRRELRGGVRPRLEPGRHDPRREDARDLAAHELRLSDCERARGAVRAVARAERRRRLREGWREEARGRLVFERLEEPGPLIQPHGENLHHGVRVVGRHREQPRHRGREGMRCCAAPREDEAIQGPAERGVPARLDAGGLALQRPALERRGPPLGWAVREAP